MKKKLLSLCLVLALALTAIGGTLAYFTDTDTKDNVFTVGGVKIQLIEQQRNADSTALEDFKDRRKLLEVCRDWRTLLISKVYSKVTLDSDESLLPLAHVANINTSFAATIRELRIPNLFEIDDSMNGLSMPELLPEPLKPLTWMNTGLVQDKEEFEFESPDLWICSHVRGASERLSRAVSKARPPFKDQSDLLSSLECHARILINKPISNTWLK